MSGSDVAMVTSLCLGIVAVGVGAVWCMCRSCTPLPAPSNPSRRYVQPARPPVPSAPPTKACAACSYDDADEADTVVSVISHPDDYMSLGFKVPR